MTNVVQWPKGTEYLPAFTPSADIPKLAGWTIGFLGDLLDSVKGCSAPKPIGSNDLCRDLWENGGGHLVVVDVQNPDFRQHMSRTPELQSLVQRADAHFKKAGQYGRLMMDISITPPRKSVEMHPDAEDSLLVAISEAGQGQLKDPYTGRFLPTFPFNPGDALYLAPGVYHGFRNLSDQPRIVAVFGLFSA